MRSLVNMVVVLVVNVVVLTVVIIVVQIVRIIVCYLVVLVSVVGVDLQSRFHQLIDTYIIKIGLLLFFLFSFFLAHGLGQNQRLVR